MSADYLEVDGPGSEAEVLDILGRLLGPATVTRAAMVSSLVSLVAGRTLVFADFALGTQPSVTLAIGDLDHDGQARYRATQRICEGLTSSTPWWLHLSSDDDDQSPATTTTTPRRRAG